ncbi:hydrolase [Niallia circulans]|uniref:Hydrolase n=1 Tax=Niallia circulans TaxID=1397 RepID=A0A553SPR2_NIACI|nr:SGNH/GDSL hydrolase family protein [Niallia circulans]TRZ38968.1 hydrolase [Niallia circulans]
MNKNDLLLFIGDSITEAGRYEDPEQIGNSYVRYVRDFLAINKPEILPQIINKGIGGNRVPDLAERWKQDVLDLKPDYVSISIGINDVWRQLDSPQQEAMSHDHFKAIYADLIEQVHTHTSAKVILMEPTVIQEDVNAQGNKLLKPYVAAIQELAAESNSLLVPTHQAFIAYLNTPDCQVLTTDGVHMNTIGNMLMAQTWLQAFLNKK